MYWKTISILEFTNKIRFPPVYLLLHFGAEKLDTEIDNIAIQVFSQHKVSIIRLLTCPYSGLYFVTSTATMLQMPIVITAGFMKFNV